MRSLGIERMQVGGRDVEVELALSPDPAPVELVTTGFTLAFDGDRVLLVRLADRDWHPPGGHRELGENPREAAMREALEESGCRVEGLTPLGWQRFTSHDPVPPDWRYPVPTAYQQFFVGIVDGSCVAPGSEAVAAGLFAPAEARNLAWVQRHRELYEEALRRVLAFTTKRGGPHSPDAAEVRAFLADLHSGPISDLEPLTGGFWSSAWGYRCGDDHLVLRVGTVPEGFHADRAAMAFDRPGLPVPPVVEIGEAFGMSYAISERRHGRFLEDVDPELGAITGQTIVGLLGALRSVPPDAGTAATVVPVDWQTPASSPVSGGWREWLLGQLVDDPAQRTAGWRAALAADAELERIFVACDRRINELVDACPERRDLIHGDLLHRNVLISEDASRVNAVFSWKCSVRGDFLYDVAWCTFWSRWHPGIAAAQVWERVGCAAELAVDDGVLDAPLRHHCYELHIGATHLGWYLWTGDEPNLRTAAAHLDGILERGPLSTPGGSGARPTTGRR